MSDEGVEATAPGADGLDVAGLTHVGKIRGHNEDQFLIASLERRLRLIDTSVKAQALQWLPTATAGTLLIVADGMGGLAGGDVASSVAVRAIGDYLCNVLPIATLPSGDDERVSLLGVRVGLQAAIAAGEARVRAAATEERLDPDMGTTLTMAYVVWPHLYVAHAGDSRFYLSREGALRRLTTDHTLAEKLRERANIEVDDNSPWHHALWNMVGGRQSDVEPEVHRLTLEDDDVLLLCSDGLTKHVSDDDIQSVIAASATAADACAELVARANAAGGSDNITVALARRASPPARASRRFEGPTQVKLPYVRKDGQKA